MGTKAGMLLLVAALSTLPASAVEPAPGPPDPIGSYANGCIRGAVELMPEGRGYQVLNLSRRRNFAHPSLVDYLINLAGQVEDAGLGRLAIGDLGQPRGGRMKTGHASHQNGLDADIWFALDLPLLPREAREREDLPSMVDPNTGRVDPTWFGAAQVRLMALAAAAPAVERIFVNPAIKLALCQQAEGDRSWLGKVRPWFGHAAHLHVRLACPADAPSCTPQEPPPPGDGCDAELMSWFDPPSGAPVPKAETPPPLPACVLLLSEPDLATPQ